MASIPFHISIKTEYPLTPKSTVQYWAEQAFYHNKGPFAGRITRIGGRWYLTVNEDVVIKQVVQEVKSILGVNDV